MIEAAFRIYMSSQLLHRLITEREAIWAACTLRVIWKLFLDTGIYFVWIIAACFEDLLDIVVMWALITTDFDQNRTIIKFKL